MLEAHDVIGDITTNDNWRTIQEAEIIGTIIPPTNDKEASVLAILTPGNCAAVVPGKDDTTGIVVVEAYNIQ